VQKTERTGNSKILKINDSKILMIQGFNGFVSAGKEKNRRERSVFSGNVLHGKKRTGKQGGYPQKTGQGRAFSTRWVLCF
jgi:hypothetical protein